MSDQGKQWRVDLSKLTGWFVLELERIGLPYTFNEADLSVRQLHELRVLYALHQLVVKGLIRVEIKDGVPSYFEVTQ